MFSRPLLENRVSNVTHLFGKNGFGRNDVTVEIRLFLRKVEICQPFGIGQCIRINLTPLGYQPIPEITKAIIATSTVNDIGRTP
jgi:hypothetical protein